MTQNPSSFVPLEPLRRGEPAHSEGSSRRRFLEIMGASLALAAGAGCTRQPPEFILPYVEQPEKEIPGIPKYFATARIVNGVAQGVIVESHQGRPTKVEGNPMHPGSLGATDVHGQSCVLDLYDPDRAKQITENGESREWEAFLAELQRLLAPIRSNAGEGLSLLSETSTSPTFGAQRAAVLAAFPRARWHQYEPAGWHNARAGALAAFGRPVHTHYRLDRAEVILAFDADFLAAGPGSTRYAHDYAARRRVRGASASMNRLYVVESEMTSTGGKSEHRLALRPAAIERLARDLDATLRAGGQAPSDTPHGPWVSALARDLLAHRGTSAVIAGESQAPAVHLLAHRINAFLENAGVTVLYTDPIEIAPEDQVASLRDLVTAMDAGTVKLLLILGGNPVYNAPADLDFAGKLEKVDATIHLSLHPDETSARTRWLVPLRHSLEDWGDARAFDGTVTIVQPLIEPLYRSWSAVEALDALVRQPGRPAYDIVRSFWQSQTKAPDFDAWWRESVRSGLVAGSALPPIQPALRTSAPDASVDGSANALDLLFRADPYLVDGRFANNAWLQELPKPITKLTWDNAVHVAPGTAQRLGLGNQQPVEMEANGRSVRGSVWISPGQAEDTIVVHLGYGRTNAGRVGNGAGFNAYLLRSSDAMWAAPGPRIRPAGGTYPLANTQMHQRMEGRDMVIHASAAEYLKDPAFAKERTEIPDKQETLYPLWNNTGYAWGMSIDLTACVNCMACVIACQAENNIPVVGKEQQLFNREMHWLRVDTYYEDGPDATAVRYQPVPCMHCEQAPCEYVCPVQATVHSADGLNDMVYNRCVGTRYCSNNCPYKVRRFNYLLFSDWVTEEYKMQRNPDVTVRSRGVMEKCTYCVQRIREVEIRARNEDRYIRDGEIQTACQQVCPTRAIVFGDIGNSGNEVARLKAEPRDYPLLAELNTRPRTTYLAEIRNPNPELAGETK
jgi:molybdopterin-containing oxidoreductase family iron-sulfur binding subunit